jgi:hypothetical protein
MCRDGNVCRGTIDGVVYSLLGVCPQYVNRLGGKPTIETERVVSAKEIHCERGDNLPS